MSRTYTNRKDKEQAKKKKDVRKDAWRLRIAQQKDYAIFMDRRGC